MNGIKYYTAAFSAFFMWGFFSLALKPISYVSSFDILFFRILSSTILIVLFSFIFRRKQLKNDLETYKNLSQSLRLRTISLTVLGGLLLGLNWFLFIYVVNKINVQSASFAYLICPIVTTILAFLILKDKLQPIQWVSIVISLVGCVLYYFTNSSNLIFALIVAVSYSLYLISQKSNIHLDKFNVLLLQMLVISIASLPYYLISGFEFPKELSFYSYILVIALLFTLIPLYLNLYALKGVSASAVGIMIYINPIIAFLLAIFYFKESINMLQIASYLLILLSIVIFNWKALKKTKP